MIKSRIDYHIHPEYSLDAQGSVEDYCIKAIKKGFEEICFTPHFDIDPVTKELARVRNRLVPMTSDWLGYYIEDVEKVRENFDLKIKIGLEVDYSPEVEKKIEKYLSEYSFDYVLGSVHNLNHIALSVERESFSLFKNMSPSELCKNYYSILEKALESGLFNCIGHIDIYKRFGLKYYGREILFQYKNFAKPVLEKMVEFDVGFELNTAGYHHIGEPYPNSGFLKMAREIGVKIVTIGSDCHKPQDFGRDIDKGLELLKNFGVKVSRFSIGKIEDFE